MDVGILGPLQASVGAVSVVPTAGKPRQVLALLALNPDRVVPVMTIMEELWGAKLPRSAATTLQTYVMQLRRRLGSVAEADLGPRAAREVLVTKYGGYMLRIDPAGVDVQQFQRLAASGRAAQERGDLEQASTQLAQALRLWRGPAQLDVPQGQVLALETQCLMESRIGVLERRIDVDLLLGAHAQLLGELQMLAAQHPLNENVTAQLMTAFYRSGHAWRALEAYRRLRSTMVEEFGLEPSARMQQLHQAVLAQDGSLDQVLESPRAGDGGYAPVPGAAAAAPVPLQRPA